MSKIQKLLSLPPRHCWLLTKTILLLVTVRLLLKSLTFPKANRIIKQVSHRSQRHAVNPPPANLISWAVDVASRLVPGGGHCLSKALTAQILLIRRGYLTKIHYGAKRSNNDDFIAHAWLECEGRIIIGGNNSNHFKSLSPRTAPPE